jgi:hypothetical protein
MPNSSAARRVLDLVTGRNPALKRLDWPIAYWLTTLVLVLSVVGTVLDVLDINLKWGVTYSPKSGLDGSRSASVQSFAYTSIDVNAVVPDLQQKLPPGVRPYGELPVTVDFDNSSLRARILRFLSSVPMDLLIVGVIWLLRRVALTTVAPGISAGDPFIKANVWRLRIVAGLILITPIVSFWSQVAVWELIDSSLPGGLLLMWYDASMMPVQFGTGVLLFVISEVFAAGVRLREDVEGLV